ncbi:Protein of unknown function [Bacillus mobilis]|nr:Protein of unknown function [Bacillus mobilis]
MSKKIGHIIDIQNKK